tara:strand:- start:5840 stop:6568 length:729 start_codon:yes stop_codon:yes gene_type:complete
MKVSICIPAYEANGRGVEFLEHNFNLFQKQTHKDIEVVISDHSKNDDIKELCNTWEDRLDIKYIKNIENRGNSSANTNVAIKNASGDIIKILFQDDFIVDETSIEKTVKGFENEAVQWLASACLHTNDDVNNLGSPFQPRFHTNIQYGENTMSSPSVISIRNFKEIPYFDENLIWLMDVEYYKQLYDAFGLPGVVEDYTVVNRAWGNQVSNSVVTQEIKINELNYVLKKHPNEDSRYNVRIW